MIRTISKINERVAVRMLPITSFEVSPTNPRRKFDEEKLNQLAQSIKEQGVLQAIIARRNPRYTEGSGGSRKEYEIIAGERRWRASKIARLYEIPARIVTMSDEGVLQIQIIENLQREAVHPLDEAEGFAHLKEVSGYTVAEIAQKVAKDERYVARRMALTKLTDEAKADLRADLISLSHALELCRLAPEIQVEALAACYESKSVYSKEQGKWDYQPNKERPCRHVRYLQEWIRQNVMLSLARAAFKADDPRLREDGLTCLECPQRSGFNKGLFHDIGNDSTCLNPQCFQAKLHRHVEIKRGEIEAKTGQAPLYISTRYGATDAEKRIVGSNDYMIIERRGVRCEHAEQAIYADGDEVGRVKWICLDKSCKDHLNRVPDSYSRPVSRSSSDNSSGTLTNDLAEVREGKHPVRKPVVYEERVSAAGPDQMNTSGETDTTRRVKGDERTTKKAA